MTAAEIIERLIAASADKVWVKELQLLDGSCRVDFWTLEPAASKGFRATSYEIKVSRSDFHRDSEEKQRGALRFSDRFWYVTPPGLLEPREIPEWAGLMEVGEHAWDWRIRKRAPRRQKAEPDWYFVVSLLRNSGDRGRDVGLLKSQVAFYKLRADELERREAMRCEVQRRRWVARALAMGGGE